MIPLVVQQLGDLLAGKLSPDMGGWLSEPLLGHAQVGHDAEDAVAAQVGARGHLGGLPVRKGDGAHPDQVLHPPQHLAHERRVLHDGATAQLQASNDNTGLLGGHSHTRGAVPFPCGTGR